MQQLVSRLQSTPADELARTSSMPDDLTEQLMAAAASSAAAISSPRSGSGGGCGGAPAAEPASPAGSAAMLASSEPLLSLSAAASNLPELVTDALRHAFLATDEELSGTDAGEYVGATAVVAVVARQHIWVAHAGESALCRAWVSCAEVVVGVEKNGAHFAGRFPRGFSGALV
eukprot:359606-Chlamydomonas_euryale.AAC.2